MSDGFEGRDLQDHDYHRDPPKQNKRGEVPLLADTLERAFTRRIQSVMDV